MDHTPPSTEQVDAFILAAIDTVPHLEALLLLWSTRPASWNASEISAKVYVDPARGGEILETLARRGLLAADSEDSSCFRYASLSPGQDELVAAVERTYKVDLIRITRMIHSKAAPAVRQFAQAFRFTKD